MREMTKITTTVTIYRTLGQHTLQPQLYGGCLIQFFQQPYKVGPGVIIRTLQTRTLS